MNRMSSSPSVAAAGVLIAAALALGGCSGNSSGPAPAGTVTLFLYHEAGGAPLVPETGEYTSAAGNLYRVEMLRYYISRVTLHRAGGDCTAPGVHLRDIMEEATLAFDLGTVPDGVYDSLSFTFGLDPATNVTGGLPATQDNLNMLWPEPWGGGYHYMMLEGRFHETADSLIGYAVHTGAMTVAPDSVRHHHDFTVTLPLAPLTVAGDHSELYLVMDVNRWFEGAHVLDLHGFMDSIMQDLTAQEALEENGAGAFRLATVVPGNAR
jgi:hypothetical protein